MSLPRPWPLLAALALTGAGCAHYPLGLSKAEWESLPPAKQEEYRKLQSIAEGQKRQDADSDRKYVDQSIRGAEPARNQ